MIGVRTTSSTGREYLIRWLQEIEPGEQWETWENANALYVDGAIHSELAEQVETLDAVTPEEEAALDRVDVDVDAAQTCMLSEGDAIIYDPGEDDAHGYRTGVLHSLDVQGRINVTLDPIHFYPQFGGRLAACTVSVDDARTPSSVGGRGCGLC